MFGEQQMYLNSENSIDNKKRVYMPSKSKVESKEQLMICSESDIYFSIYSYIYINRYIEKLEKRYLKVATFDEKLEILKEIEYFKSKIVDSCAVDNQKRIILPHEIINNYDIKDKIIFVGAKDHLKCFSSYEDVKKYRMGMQ